MTGGGWIWGFGMEVGVEFGRRGRVQGNGFGGGGKGDEFTPSHM